jgi:capsular exopolysaccharide synthesis family protein
MSTIQAHSASTPSRVPAQDRSTSVPYETLINSLSELGFDTRRQKLLGIVGCERRAGVSTVACNLALEVARGGSEKVLLIDANLSHPRLHQLFSAEVGPGLVNAMAQEPPVDQCIQPTDTERLHLLTSGFSARPASQRFRAARFKNVLDEVRDEYDLVIVDLPPAIKGSNAFPMATVLDGVLLIVEAERNPVDRLQWAKRQFIHANATILGVVLNKCRWNS